MMSEVRCIAQEELIDTVTIGKEATDPTRKLKFCTCRGQYGYGQEHAVIVEVIGKRFALFTSKVEDDVLEFFNHCLDVVPCFWSPKVPSHSHLAEIFCEQVLTKLVELMRLYGNSWSVAHMCVSLPLPEDTMMILLASDSFKDHFTSTHHPKGYTLLHLAVEMESLPACRAIMRCSDQWLHKDPGLFVEDNEGVTPLNRAAIAGAWECSYYLQQSQSLTHDTTPKQPQLSKAPHKFTQGGVPFHSSISYVKSQQQMGMDTQLHDLILKKFPNQLQVEKQRQLVKLLISCNPNTLNAEGMTPLHLAVQAGDVLSVKALIAFDADALVVNSYSETSLDLAKRRGLQDISDLLHLSCHSTAPVPTTLVDYHEPIYTGYTARGERILCLDGGGIKGLILIDMLSTIEKIAGRRIVELFDWIIGTSTGGILALALVYTDLSLNEIRRMYFDLKNDVFVDKIGDILLPDEQTEVLESILKKRVGEQTKLGSKTHPKVLISATDMDSTPLKLVFFNNFETGTHGKDQLVWIAGRATSAAPFYFKQCGSYADGGLKANNPSMSGLTRIHEYYTESGWRDYKIGCVVSLGCGMFHKKLEPLDAKIREVIPDVVHLHDIPGHLRHLNVIKAVQTAKQGYRGLKQCASTARSFLFDVLIAEICESDEEPVRHTKAFCERDHTPFIRLSPQLDMPIELDENSDEKLVDMLITTKWYVQAQIDHFHRIKTLTEL